MSKSRVYRIIIVLVVAVVFNVICFTVPTMQTTSFWISYAFAMIAIVMQECIWIFAWRKANTLRSKFYGLPILIVGTVYLILQIVISIVFIAFPFAPYYVPLIIDVVIFALAVTLMLLTDVGRDIVSDIDETVKKDTSSIMELRQMVELISIPTEYAEASSALRALADEIRYSDPISSTHTIAVENQIKDTLANLQEMHGSSNEEEFITVIQQLRSLVERRNAIAKVTKGA